MKICFLTNNISTKNEDLTTYDIALSSLKHGHEIYFGGVADIYSQDSNILGNLKRLSSTEFPQIKKRSNLVRAIESLSFGTFDLSSFDVLFLRHKYKKQQKISEDTHKTAREYSFHLSERGVFVLNDPKYLPFSSSKIATIGLEKSILAHKQLVSSKFDKLYSFCENDLKFNGVLKPVSGSGGGDIFFIEKKNLANTLKNLLEKGQVVAQSFIPNHGDKRILVLDGEPVGWYMRVASESGGLNNIHAGGRAVKCDLDERDIKILKTVKHRLKKYGMYFVGVDILGGYLSEINSENPGGTIRCDSVGGFNTREKVVEFLENKIKKK